MTLSCHRPERPARAGFTLLEVLTVVAAVALLSALLLPAFGSAMETAQMAQSMSNLRQLVTANTAYAADHGQYCPADDRWNMRRWHGGRTSAAQPFDPTKGFLAEYLGKSRQVGICPLFRDAATNARSFESGTGGYGYNASYVGGTPQWAYDKGGSRVAARPSQLAKMNTVMFTTSGYATGDSIQEYPYSEPPFWDFGAGPTEARPSPSVHFRFQGKALIAWCDGRVSTEERDPREVGDNPHGGEAEQQQLGWFGPDTDNGYWNPNRSEPLL